MVQLLKSFVKTLTPQILLHQLRKSKFTPKLVAMGIIPKAARAPVEYLGTEYGGHAVIVDTIYKDSIVYSLGAGLDISFEEELINRTGCFIHVYDPTPRSISWLNERFQQINNSHPATTNVIIHPIGIWSEDKKIRFFAPKNPEDISYSITNIQGTQDFIEVDCISLMTAMSHNGHNHIDLLKLNVEGAEYAILNSAFDSGIRPKKILINYDELHTEGDSQAIVRLSQLATRIVSLGYNVIFAELSRVTYSL